MLNTTLLFLPSSHCGLTSTHSVITIDYLSTCRHLFNFFLLFASNVENLIAYIFRDIVGERIMHHIEVLLGILYLYFVMHNLFWFIGKRCIFRLELDYNIELIAVTITIHNKYVVSRHHSAIGRKRRIFIIADIFRTQSRDLF